MNSQLHHRPLHTMRHTGHVSRRLAVGQLSIGLVAGLGGMGRVERATAQGGTPMADREGPPFLEAWLSTWVEDPGTAGAVYAEDAVLEDVPAGARYEGRDAIRAHIEEEFAAFPDHDYEVNSAFMAGDWAAAEVVLSGAYTGTLPGLPPGTGQLVKVPAVAIFELADGMIRREAHYYDVYGLLVQLGVIPAPEAA